MFFNIFPTTIQYYYFEKDIELFNKNYVGFRSSDIWFDDKSFGDINNFPYKRNAND